MTFFSVFSHNSAINLTFSGRLNSILFVFLLFNSPPGTSPGTLVSIHNFVRRRSTVK